MDLHRVHPVPAAHAKTVGRQFGFDLAACDLRVRAVTFRTVNANNQGDYFTGLASVMPNTCRAGDDITRPLGDPREASIAAALDFLGGRTCTPITSSATTSGLQQGQSARQGLGLPEREMLQALIDKSQENVTGTVRVKLYKGHARVVGRKSPRSLYDMRMVTFEADQGAYNQRDAEGFIKLNALRLRLGARARKK